MKKAVLKNFAYPQENTCAGVSFNKVKKSLKHGSFPVNNYLFFLKFLTFLYRALSGEVLKTNINLFSQLLSVNREWGVGVHNVLSLELFIVPLDLLYPNGAMRRTAKSNLLNDIEIK